jgi:predicted nucleic acid-binding protein
MTTWLVDASVLLSREDADDPNHPDARRLLEGSSPVATLDLAYYEVTNVAIRRWGDSQAATRLRGVVAAIEEDGGLIRANESLLGGARLLRRPRPRLGRFGCLPRRSGRLRRQLTTT